MVLLIAEKFHKRPTRLKMSAYVMSVRSLSRRSVLRGCYIYVLILIIVLLMFFSYEYRKRSAMGFTDDDWENFPLETCSCKGIKDMEWENKRLEDVFQDDPYEFGTSFEVLLRKHPNAGPRMFSNHSRCSLLPFVSGLDWDGVWQKASPDLLLYSVSCDRSKDGRCVKARILAMGTKRDVPGPYCYFWANVDSDPMVVQAKKSVHIDYQSQSSRLYPLLISCRPPTPLDAMAVSVSYSKCAPVTNFLEINRHESKFSALLSSLQSPSGAVRVSNSSFLDSVSPSNTAVGICGPALFYYHEDISLRLVEWFEILRALHVAKVFLYVTKVNPKVEKVLQYYEKIGFVDLTSFSYPSPYINDPMIRKVWISVQRRELFGLENIYFSDCILRNRHQHRYLMHLDPDELPILGKYSSFTDFIVAAASRNTRHPKNFELGWRTFHEDVAPGLIAKKLPGYFYFLRHNMVEKRCTKADCNNSKTIYDTRMTLAAFSHRALFCKGKCQVTKVDRKIAYVAHFRRNCDADCEPRSFRSEVYLSQFVEQVIPAVDKVKKKLKL